jgi:anti-sigma regulatory factor (Ser/Thr protein kinase)
MTANGHQIIRLEFSSAFEMLDFVQVVSDHLARGVGLDEDSLHWVSVAIRESVINAIKHGNKSDAAKHVFVEFETRAHAEAPELTIRVRDQGEGFDPETVETEGFGLRLLAKLASRWGCDCTDRGCKVWFEVDRRSGRFSRTA